MAGAGYKLFNTGDVLTAAQVNTYLQEQVVMVFATAAARTTALSSVLAEGMVSYLQSTDAVEVYNGTSWVSVGGSSPLTTKGDLYTYSTTNARLAVGSNGDTLVADNSTTTGLRWTPSLASKNYVINGAMDWWQRGTSGFTTGGAYTADRWLMGSNSGTLAASRSTDVPTNPYFNYSYSLGGTSAQNTQIYTRIESIEASQLAGQTVTLTVWAKSTAGTTKISFATVYPSATDSWGGSNVTDVIGDLSGTSPSGSWTRYTATFTVNALATRGYQVIIYRNGTETSTTLITGVKLELGSVSTPFTRAGGTLAGELAACQRYYYRAYNDTDNRSLNGLGWVDSSTVVVIQTSFPVQMRTRPTAVETTGTASNYLLAGSGLAANATAVTFDGVTTDQAACTLFTISGGGTAGRVAQLRSSGANRYIAWSAEL